MKSFACLFCGLFFLVGAQAAQASQLTCSASANGGIAIPSSSDIVLSTCSGLRLSHGIQNVTYTPPYAGAKTYCLANKDASNDYFVPARTDEEWTAFYKAASSLNVKITDGACCATSTVDKAGQTWCAVPPEGMTGCHRYLYYLNTRDSWYISPENCTGWSWNYYTQQVGSYTYGHGANAEGSFTCTGGEGGSYGIGCSTGGGNMYKVLTIYGVSPSTDTGMVCQDKPSMFGGPARWQCVGCVCAPGIKFYSDIR